MAIRKGSRKAMGATEEAALIAWRSAKPFTAMTMLWRAGYTVDQRLEFLTAVAGVTSLEYVQDWSDDYLAEMTADFI